MGKIVRNCRLCDKPMQASPFMLCKTCLNERETVRSHVMKHPSISIESIASATDVSYDKVERMIKLGLKQKVN